MNSILIDGFQVPIISVAAKSLRTEIVVRYLALIGVRKVVCFTSGNAGACLRAHQHLDVVTVGPGEPLMPGRWWHPAEIATTWPGHFDATSGHLPQHLTTLFAQRLAEVLGPLGAGPYVVPTGSGETLCALAQAYPQTELWALINTGKHTEHHAEMPLAWAVARHRVVDNA